MKTENTEERILPYLKEHQRRSRAKRRIALLSAATVLCVLAATCIPAFSAAGSGPALQAENLPAASGETVAVTVSASADSGAVVLLAPENGAAQLAGDYVFTDDKTSVSGSSGDSVELNRTADGTEYWFQLQDGASEVLQLRFAAADAGTLSAVLRAASADTLENAQSSLETGTSVTLQWAAAETAQTAEEAAPAVSYAEQGASSSGASSSSDASLSASSSSGSDTPLEAQSVSTNLSDYITGVTINGGASAEVKSGDDVNIAISYEVAGNTLSSDEKTLTYQLPDVIAVNEAQSGSVFTTQGEVIGTYAITTGGAVTITFNDSYDPTSDIAGKIKVEGQASYSGSGESQTISIGGATLTIDPPTTATSDLYVQKNADTSTTQDGKIHYTVVAYTTLGTSGTVNITDTMTGSASFDNDFVITAPDGTVMDGAQYPVQIDGSSFAVYYLPKLAAGERYTITYTATPDWSGAATASTVYNSVTAASGSDSYTASTTTQLSLLTKTGSYNSKTGEISWSVHVNGAHINLNGYTLSDVLHNPDGSTQAVTGSVYVSPQLGGSWTVSLPYTFTGDDYNDYWITYTTTPDSSAFGTSKYSNDAVLTKDSETHTAGSGSVNVTGKGYITKQFDAESAIDGKDGAKYTWSSSLAVPAAGFTTDWFYNDFLDSQSGRLLVTADTANITVTGTSSSGQTVTLTEGTDYSVDLFYYNNGSYTQSYSSVQALRDAGGKATTFRVDFLRTILPSEYKTITITYDTYADYSALNVGGSRNFTNSASIGTMDDRDEARAEHSHKKTASIAKQGKNSYGKYTDQTFTVDYDKAGGELFYRLLVNTDGSASGALTITDTLPAGTEFDESSFRFRFYGNDYYEPDSVWVNGKQIYAKDLVQHTVGLVQNADGTTTLTITIAEGYGTNAMSVYYGAKITDQKNGKAAYTNTAVLGDTSVSQTTTVNHKTVGKTAEQGDGKTVSSNVVTYRIVLNPEGADLDPLSDKLTLTDTLSYTAADVKSVYLMPGSVKLFLYDASAENSEGAQLDASSVTYSYDAAKQQTGFTIPDSKAVVLQYQYYVDQSAAKTTLSNSASLSGTIKNSGSNKIEINANSSSATADQKILTFYKVDADNNSVMLPGAKFALSRWENGGWTSVGSYTTDEKGMFRFDGGTSSAAVKPELVLYQLTETEAPAGYALNATPYYFVWGPENYTAETLASAMAADVTAAGASDVHYYLLSGGTAYIQDARDSIEVQKVWLAPDGTTDPNTHTEVTVQLLKNGAAEGSPVTLNAANNWSNTWEGLDQSGSYTYTVVETAGEEGYTVSYDNNSGITRGKITVRNQGAPVQHYTLPATGGPGTGLMIAAGQLLVLCPAAAIFRRRKKCAGKSAGHAGGTPG